MIKKVHGLIERRTIVIYSLPAFVLALPIIPVYIVLPTIYGSDLSLGLATTGLMLLLARLFDTVTDPIIGFLTDNFGYKKMRRKPWICCGALIGAVGLFKILNPDPNVTGFYLLVWSLVLYTGWTMIAVPYTAWGAELTRDYHQRTKITGWREGIGLAGILFAGILNAGTAQLGWSLLEYAKILSWVAIPIGIILIIPLILCVPDYPLKPNPVERKKIFTQLRILSRNILFFRLLTAWFFNGLANGIPAVLFFIYLEHGLGIDAKQQPLFILTYFFSAIISIPIWSKVSIYCGKHRTWCYAMLVACSAFILVPVIPIGGAFSFFLVCLVTGAGLGADLSLPPAIQGDVVDYELLRTGHGKAGLQFSLWGMSTKLSLAVAVGIALPGLEFFGFNPDDVTIEGRQVLLVIYSQIPIVIKIIAIAIMWRFPLTIKKHQVISNKLKKLDLLGARVEVDE